MTTQTPGSTASNVYSAEHMAVAEAAFMAAYPTYAGTQKLDILRAEDYSRLDRLNHIYLDYTGGGLYADSQLSQHMELMRANVFGNPHSNNPSSAAMTDLVERARHHILAYFNADPEEYTAIFTANASAALKLVGESYPFQEGGHFALTFDNHNSVNGIREFARAKGAQVTYVPSELPNLNLDRRALTRALEGANPEAANLFAFPAQSNFSGVKHPLSLIDQAQEAGWDVLLDAAAFVPSSRLDLSIWKPDFVSLSFYKIFGYPTGVGCLLARTSSLAKLVRPWFAGGTITLASVQGMKHAFGAHEIRFEDGTVNYLNIAGVEIGLKHIAAIGIDVIAERVRCLTGWLLDNLMALEHSNGRPMVRLYGTTELDERGGTLAINFYDPDGRLLDYHRVEELANERLISIRTGCFCNPGTSEIAEELTEQEVQAGFNTGNHPALPAFVEMLGELAGKSSGAVRVSVGLASNFADAHRFMDFAQSFRDQTSEKVGVVSFDIETCRFIREGP